MDGLLFSYLFFKFKFGYKFGTGMFNRGVLKSLRGLMAQRNIGIYVLPRTDEHQSEYLSPCNERVAFLSGFTGSNALALVSQKQALVWTDGRYFLQASKELSPEWQMKKLMQGEKKWFEHITEHYDPASSNIEIDARLIPAKSAKERIKYFQEKKFKINFADNNLVDELWIDRPKEERKAIFSHEEYAGKSMAEKVNWIRNKIKQKKGQGAIFTDLGEIAWILNLRSSQIPFNPFFKSTLIITLQNGTLYLPESHPQLLNSSIHTHLSSQKITLAPYPPILPPKLLHQPQLSYSLFRKIKQPIEWQEGISLYRAVRTEKEIEGFRRCHLADGLAMAKFWAWRTGREEVDQYEAAGKMDGFRRQQEGNMGLSFNTISGGGANGAVIHYHATKETSAIVRKDMVHLVDSGGQYLDGTTDVTRAFHFGTPTQDEKDAYTRVLLGNLDIQRLKWPKSVKLTGAQIDILARRHLWKQGLEYSHGTGHGVGHFGSVHESPVGISRISKTVFQPNMIVTNEPGYYESGKFGIRIENMLCVREIGGGLLGFENFTLCPYDKGLLDLGLLTREDVEYINGYHERVFGKLSPHLEGDRETLEWLKAATSPIPIHN